LCLLIAGAAIAAVVMLSAAAAIAVAERTGDWLTATLITAAAFALAAVALGLALRRIVAPAGTAVVEHTASSSNGSERDLYGVAQAAGLTHPHTLWDIATLVALGFIHGSTGKRTTS